MKKLYFTSVLLCAIITYADKNCQYPASEDFVYHLRPYVEECNVKGISQLTTQLSTLKRSKSIFDLDQCTKNYVDRVYKNIVDKRDEKSLKLIAPFMVKYGYEFLRAPVRASSKRYLLRGRWEVDVVSQVPGIMTADIKKYKIYEITTAWPLIPYAAQQRIKKELNTYYDDNCSIELFRIS